MIAYNLVIGRFFQASICVTLHECPWHPYIQSLPTLIILLVMPFVSASVCMYCHGWCDYDDDHQ